MSRIRIQRQNPWLPDRLLYGRVAGRLQRRNAFRSRRLDRAERLDGSDRSVGLREIIQPPAELYKHAPFSLFASHQSPHTAHVPFLKDEAKRQGAQLLYASDYTNGVVDVFQQKVNGSLVGQYTGFAAPTGLASDGSSLYIADLEYESVFVFPFGNNATPSLILNDSGWLPWSVAVAPSGEVAVVNTSDVNANPGNVTFYKTGPASRTWVAETGRYWLDYGWYDSSARFLVRCLGSGRHKNLHRVHRSRCEELSADRYDSAHECKRIDRRLRRQLHGGGNDTDQFACSTRKARRLTL